jgi:hypothetical protein
MCADDSHELLAADDYNADEDLRTCTKCMYEMMDCSDSQNYRDACAPWKYFRDLAVLTNITRLGYEASKTCGD